MACSGHGSAAAAAPRPVHGRRSLARGEDESQEAAAEARRRWSYGAAATERPVRLNGLGLPTNRRARSPGHDAWTAATSRGVEGSPSDPCRTTVDKLAPRRRNRPAPFSYRNPGLRGGKGAAVGTICDCAIGTVERRDRPVDYRGRAVDTSHSARMSRREGEESTVNRCDEMVLNLYSGYNEIMIERMVLLFAVLPSNGQGKA